MNSKERKQKERADHVLCVLKNSPYRSKVFEYSDEIVIEVTGSFPKLNQLGIPEEFYVTLRPGGRVMIETDGRERILPWNRADEVLEAIVQRAKT